MGRWIRIWEKVRIGVIAAIISRKYDKYQVTWRGPTLSGKGVQGVVMRG